MLDEGRWGRYGYGGVLVLVFVFGRLYKMFCELMIVGLSFVFFVVCVKLFIGIEK